MNMTPKQLEQWKDACDALRDGEEIEYQASDMGWWPTTTISRCYLHRRKPDPLAEIKAAFAAGKRVENINAIRTKWLPLENPQWTGAADDYRIAPWSLSDHMRRFFPTWDEQTQPLHRTDWTEDELPNGVRSLLNGEKRVVGLDEILLEGNWVLFGLEPNHKHSDTNSWKDSNKTRTSRPLPTPPRMVPLGPEDVPPGSALSFERENGACWSVVQRANRLGAEGAHKFYTWPEMQKLNFLIHRPGDNNPDGSPAWRKCEKGAK